jgi:predicted NAD/FAD-dependent oxidoreductase
VKKYRQPEFDIVVVGAGLSGLSAADKLLKAGLKTLLVDKGRGFGGRLASRRIGDATFDHGAQFMTAKSQPFKAYVKDWIKAGILEAWYQDSASKHLRYRGVPTMNAIAKYLARGKESLLSTKVVRVENQQSGWQVILDQGSAVSCRALLMTCPVPQTLELLAASNISLPSDIHIRLETIEYAPCIAVMAVLETPSILQAPGGLSLRGGPIDWISDNQQKKVSGIPAVTIHASADFSAENFDRDRHKVGLELIELARPMIGEASVVDFQVHGWRYSKPRNVDSDQCLMISDFSNLPPLVLAGDAFAGPRFEGAVISGWAAANRLLKTL